MTNPIESALQSRALMWGALLTALALLIDVAGGLLETRASSENAIVLSAMTAWVGVASILACFTFVRSHLVEQAAATLGYEREPGPRSAKIRRGLINTFEMVATWSLIVSSIGILCVMARWL